jgi:hypothetical protein
LNEPDVNTRSKSNTNTPESWSPRTTRVGSLGLVSMSSSLVEDSAPAEVVSNVPVLVAPAPGRLPFR